MKLPRSLVEHIGHQIVRGLVRGKVVELDDRAALVESISNALSDDLQVEDKLNDEVREIMNNYADEMTRTGVQYHDMFKMIKQELIRKRKLIL